MTSRRGADPHLWVVILAGGVGARLWPASRPERPKPLLRVASDRPLIREAVDRALALVEPDHLAILAGEDLQAVLRSLLPDLSSDCYWIEPRSRGTGPALAWAAHRLYRRDPEGVLVSLHADHRIEFGDAFAPRLYSTAEIARREDILMTLAVRPDRPETGFGYIRPGSAFASRVSDGPVARRVDEFVEKPDPSTALRYVTGGYLWNTGIFVLPVARLLEEIRRHAPEISESLGLLDTGDEVGFFEGTPTISVDEAVFERSRRVGAVSVDLGWDDLGSWEALTRSLPTGADRNWTVGHAHTVEARNSVVWAEDGPVVLFGVENLVVARSGGITLVTTRERSGDLKQLLGRLPPGLGETPSPVREAEPAPEDTPDKPPGSLEG